MQPQPGPWWQRAVFYQVYPRSFADSDGDGVGDLDGLIGRLDYLSRLGVDALWLNPVTVSPMVDHGYDVADPRDVDPLFGGLEALDRLVAAAHRRDIKVTMDLVPNHTSAAHPWFVEALAGGPGSPARARYYFRDGRGPGGRLPPNNWVSVFGGPAWTRVTEADGRPGQWYLHLFDAQQPDLNWDNPEVFEDFAKTLRFWLDRGVDGFRIDVAHGMAKAPGLPDMDLTSQQVLRHRDEDPRFNQPGVHPIHRAIRAVLNEYPRAVSVGELWVHDNAQFAAYLRPGELHLGFNFRLLQADYTVADIRDAIDNSLAAIALVNAVPDEPQRSSTGAVPDGPRLSSRQRSSTGAVPTWTLENHDVDRAVTRYGGGAVGLARARAMALVMLALPGVVFIYNGQELGLPGVDLPDEVLQDPVWERSGHTQRGRDGCRVPLPWSGDTAPFGFSTTAATWLPMPPQWAPLTVQRQHTDPDSTLTLFQKGLEIRRRGTEFTGDQIEWLPIGDDGLAYRRGRLICAVNTGRQPMALPDGHILLSSGPLLGDRLPPDTAAWLVQSRDSVTRGYDSVR